jgi:hypothetical protein
VRFRVVAAICGIVLVAMGILFLLLRLGSGGAALPLSDGVSGKLAIPLMVVGAVVLIGVRLVPLNWVFVCPHGLIRTQGTAWAGVGWADVARFEDATLSHRAVTMRQCRIVLKDGAEWGFLAEYVAEYGRLTECCGGRLTSGVSPRRPARPRNSSIPPPASPSGGITHHGSEKGTQLFYEP